LADASSSTEATVVALRARTLNFRLVKCTPTVPASSRCGVLTNEQEKKMGMVEASNSLDANDPAGKVTSSIVKSLYSAAIASRSVVK
jgi:hypothetical protein